MLRAEVILPVSEVVDTRSQATPDAVALQDLAGSVSYRVLAQRVAALAGQLRASGIRPGERVGVYMANGTAWVEATLATVRAGAVSVAVPAQANAAEAAFMLADSEVRATFVDADHLEAARAAVAAEPGLEGTVLHCALAGPPPHGQHAFGTLAGQDGVAELDAEQDLDAPAWILYTSGTTGRPKGVLLTQRSMMWVVAAGWLPFFDWQPEDLVLCPLPLTHSYPLDSTLAALAAGATQFLLAGFSPTATFDVLEAHSVTVLLGVPTVFSYLLAEAEASGRRYARRTLRMCVSAGAVLAPEVGDRATAMLGAPILDAYGATEASTAITMCGLHGTHPRGSCGVSLPGMALRVVDPVTDADRAADQEGEVIARGPGIMLGYHNRPEETAAALRDGWYRTGDLGRLDRHGNLSITGRLKDIIIRGGENIAPAEIETVVMELGVVDDCAVVGLEHAELGEIPVLAVVGAAGTEPGEVTEAVRAFCRARLPRYKRPDQVVVVEAVPRTGSGKVKRHELREVIEVMAS
ncbi:MAG: class I adenylate-forming enzyme family protein [Solirubrobacteraceae bacterium]